MSSCIRKRFKTTALCVSITLLLLAFFGQGALAAMIVTGSILETHQNSKAR